MTGDGVVPRASYILAPLSRNDPMVDSGPRGELRRYRYQLEQANIFLSILLGDDQTPDDNLHTTLWLPQYLKKRAATTDNGSVFIELMKVVLFGEVMNFGARATGVAKVFARLNLDLVERLLSHRNELRSALQEIAQSLDTENVEPRGVDQGVSRIIELQPPRVDDLLSIIRYLYNRPRQFDNFLSILLGEDLPHGGESVTPTVWLPDVLKKERDGSPNCKTFQLCLKLLEGPFKEVLKFGVRATDVAKAFARMDIVQAENLLANPEDLRSTLKRFNTIAENKDTQELIDMFISPFETGPSTVDALPENLLPNIEPLDVDYTQLAVLHYFGKSEDED